MKNDLFIRALNVERHERRGVEGSICRVVGDIALVLYMQVWEIWMADQQHENTHG